VADPQSLPEPLEELLSNLDLLTERSDRIEALISLGESFREVPPEVATRPFAEDHRVPGCESEAYVWSTGGPDGTVRLHFAVENPQGVSAMALAAILDRTLSGLPPEEIVRVPPEIVYRIFGRELSMGKSMGLTGMIESVRREAKERLDRSAGAG
jgi:cysteine desulfuration protein SufE